jgi:DNA-binding SARP family transcriptional activator
MPHMIRVRLLGPVEVSVAGAAAPVELLWRKHIALLVYLARSSNRSRSRDQLITLLWDEKTDDAARHSLNEAIRILRRCTDDGIDRQQQRVQLAEGSVQLDVDDFERAIAADDYATAAQLVVGEFMEGFSVPDAWGFEEWLSQERRYWRERSVLALARCAQEMLASGDAHGALANCERAWALDPTSEATARIKLNACAIMGDRSAALRFYEQFAERLDEELGIQPDPQTDALIERIRAERVWTSAEGSLPVTARRAPLTGLQHELASLVASWTACSRERRCGLAVIEGDAGTGKTRLLEELAIRARLDGGSVSSVRAVESDRVSPWATALGLLDAAGAGANAELPLLDRLRDTLAETTKHNPVLVCIDDAHCSDDDSAAALAVLTRDLARQPVLFAVSLLSHAGPTEIEALRSRIGRDLNGTSVRTHLLDADALRALARWSLPSYDDAQIERVSRRISVDSAGIAFVAVELLHAIANGLDVGRAHAAWPEPFRTFEQTMPGELPDAVVAALRVGYRKLSQNAQKILAAASVLAPRVSADLLAQATFLEPAALGEALDELEWQRWLVADPRGYSFVARIAREVVARDMLTEGQRQRILAAAESMSNSAPTPT